MLVIYKYRQTEGLLEPLLLPEGAKLLKAEIQDGVPTIWALVNTETRATRKLYMKFLHTGEPVSDYILSWKFLNTCLLYGGSCVVHIFVKWE